MQRAKKKISPLSMKERLFPGVFCVPGYSLIQPWVNGSFLRSEKAGVTTSPRGSSLLMTYEIHINTTPIATVSTIFHDEGSPRNGRISVKIPIASKDWRRDMMNE